MKRASILAAVPMLRSLFLVTILSSLVTSSSYGVPMVLEGPVDYNGHVYFLLDNSNWTDAEAAAVQLGGHLVTINDQTENAWIWDTFGVGTSIALWNGLHDSTPDSSFAWISGQPVTYTNWANGEPNNGNSTNNFGHLWGWSTPSGQWTDWFDLAVIEPPFAPATTPIFGVVEVIPEPSSAMLLTVGSLVALLRRRIQ